MGTGDNSPEAGIVIVRRLDAILVDRIAAGEVVERPASALKELVENAIDAGATQIEITLEAGGRKLIRVVDNGSGMSLGDLELAVERHATSKLPDSDLTHISTLGFRGEALPSIGSVSRLSLLTRQQSEPNGWELRLDAGRKTGARPASGPIGTRVEVRDLFYATPARLKFLKTDRSEAQAAVQIIKRLAMAHPHIRFSLVGDGFTALDYAATGADGLSERLALIQRLAQILGREFRDNSIPVDALREGVRLTGFVSLPTYHQASAAGQYMFVNQRPVRDKVLVGALRGAYADFMSSDRHPVVALFIECDPAFVDVNVHPAKTEVRFRDPGLVRGLIVGGIKQALSEAGHRAATTGGSATLGAFRASPFSQYRPPDRGDIRDWRDSPYAPGGFGERAQATFVHADAPSARVETSEPSLESCPLGAAMAQLHETYIVAQTADGFVLVDQHAAHERLVYERLKRQREEGDPAPRQMLLIPEIIELDEGFIARFDEFAAEFEKLGLVLEPFGPGALAVREVPSSLSGGNIARLVRDLSQTCDEWGSALALEARVDYVLKTFACHHSIRSGRRLRVEEMNALLREMEATPGSGQCNHGRPTYVELKLGDVERLFGRR